VAIIARLEGMGI